jgi:hypothetical protein
VRCDGHFGSVGNMELAACGVTGTLVVLVIWS